MEKNPPATTGAMGMTSGLSLQSGGRRWLDARRRDRARKHLRRKVRKAEQQLWLIETTLGRQGLLSSPVHRALQATLEALERFRDAYERHTTE